MRSTWVAALVHVFTALGAVCALFAIRAIFNGAWEAAFGWMGAALIIDAVDGTFARMANVKVRLPRFSGERLDLVIDYVTYVLVPALALWQAGFLQGTSGFVLASLILLSSLFHFSDMESKTEDHAFVGFPAIWNVVAFYVFALDLTPLVAGLVVLLLVGLTFVPWKWAHPMRTKTLRPVTLAVSVLWAGAAVLTVWWGFPATPVLSAILLLVAAYALALTLFTSRPGKLW